jgi:excisionase family DNA binding protein
MEKKSISVPEMRGMLGMKKVESYWLVKQGHFQVVRVGGKMRILVDSFEDWYNSQFHYKKVNGPEPGQNWPASWSVPEAANILRITPSSVYDLMKKEQLFQTFIVNGQTRIRKDSFEEWYQSQSHYKKQEDAAPQELLDATLSVGEAAKLLGIHRNSVYNMINKRHLFETVRADDKIRIYKDSFEKWLNSQAKHRMITEEGE